MLKNIVKGLEPSSTLKINEISRELEDKGKKIVKFSLDCQIKKVPQTFNKYNPILNANILSLTYDKNLIKLKSILDELNAHKITFDEINTYENDLEDIFIDLIRNND